MLVLSIAVSAGLAVAVTRHPSPPGGDAPPSTPLAARSTKLTPAAFLDTYLQGGRIIRRDQGGDTVSEGQAYGMLIALGARDREAFASIWSWTRTRLMRDDGLLSWRWEDGDVVDPSSAADADLDTARALVQAASVFDEPSYARAGVALGVAILDHETVSTPAGRVLVAGQWATSSPYWFNPSYVSPVATDVLAEASGDPRWKELSRGSDAAVRALTRDDRLPPDWAQLAEDGTPTPAGAPGGGAVEYGYDAARTVLRYAESCTPAHRTLAREIAGVVSRTGGAPVARYDLAGSPQTGDASPLVTVSQAAGLASGGESGPALDAIREAGRQQQRTPTYYGDAWTVLGPLLLTDPALGGCPSLDRS